MNLKTPSGPSPERTRPWLLPGSPPLLAQPAIVAAQAPQLFALRRGQSVSAAALVPVCLGHPVTDGLRWGLELAG